MIRGSVALQSCNRQKCHRVGFCTNTSAVMFVNMHRTKVSAKRRKGIFDVCVHNAMKRVADNDPTMTELDWSGWGCVDDESLKPLADALHNNCRIGCLKLSWNRNITDYGCATLESELRHSAVKQIDLQTTGVRLAK